MRTIRIRFFLLYILSIGFVSAQTADDARQYCKNGEYAKAMGVLSNLLKQKPKDATLNLLNGICLFEIRDMQTSEKYLQVAAQRNLSDAFYYLGEIQYQSYRFDESVESFARFIADPKSDVALKTRAEKRTAQSQVAARLMKGVEKIQIIDSLVVDKFTFMNYYQLSRENGSVTQGDTIAGAKTLIATSVYQNQRNDRTFFSEKVANKGLDIFTRNRLMDSWGEKVSLPDAINTKANENFPFVLSDGVTLYFASDGAGTMGGYDIFVTRYNLATQSYLSPENVGMPINSIYNDYLLAIDEQNNIGWFASDRHQPKDKVVIYVFIPNETKKIIENETPQRIVQLAGIHAIRETWVKGADYSSKLHKIKHFEKDTLAHSEEGVNFRFVIDDQRVYRSYDRFRNEEAKSTFREALKTGDQLRTSQKELEMLRIIYSGADQSLRQKLSTEILSLENEVEKLIAKQYDLEQKVRKLEKE